MKKAASRAPVLLAALWLLALFAPLLSPARALANRDIALFHLPLRASFQLLARLGPPLWNPWLNGGQPVLSNPSYAAFYPPSWLALALPPAYALNLLVVLHAALAFAGAWRLARRLGCGRGAAALAALGYTGSGAALSLVSAFTLFCSMAWFPWVLAAGDAALRGVGPRERVRGGLGAALALALQLLNGEPATVLVSGLGLLALAASAAARSAAGRECEPMRAAPCARIALRALATVACVAALALALAAVQLLPTSRRLADSPRAGGLPPRHSVTWSAPPERLVELVFPRFYGDPARDQENLYFGWHLHDRDYPYVLSIYPGLLLAVLGFSALVRWPVPRRLAWTFAAVGSAALAVGRHDPFDAALRAALPGLALIRFPEKFAILTVASLVFAGALGWQHLLNERQAGRRGSADLPLALAAVFLATAAALTALLYLRPALAPWLVTAHGAPGAGAASVARGVAYLRGAGWWAVATAAAVAVLLALCRLRRPSARALSALAVALLAADLWHYGHGLILTLPAAEYRAPPPLARALLARRQGGTLARVYTRTVPDGRPELVLRGGDPGLALVRTQLARLDPYSGALWGLPYALNEDYDLMLTTWARLALVVLHSEWRHQPDLAYRFLGAWNVATVVERRPSAEWIAEAERRPGAPPLPGRPVANPYQLPRYRFVPRASFHSSYASALAVARLQRYALDRQEHCVRADGVPGTVDYPGRPELLSVADRGGRIVVSYRSLSAAFFTVAMTFDDGWRARLDGHPLATYPTAACQLAVELPAGVHRLTLAYRDPMVGYGMVVSLLTLAGCAAGLAWARRVP